VTTHANNSSGDAPPRFTARLGDRSLFPDLEARAYLNHSGISAPSLPVFRAIEALYADYAKHGMSAFVRWQAQRERLRALLAGLIGASAPTDIAFVQSTTRGVSDIALCFPWRAGDRLILFKGEFPANVTPWQSVAALFNIGIVFLPLSDFAKPDAPDLSRLEDELRRGARLVAVSAVQFQTGLRMPLKAMASLCHAFGAELFVDGIQACGATPINVTAEHVDYLACGSHKWLMGLEGTGFVYIRPDRIAALRPIVAGWLSHEDGLGFLLEGPGRLRYDRPIRKRADFLEGGNYNSAGCAALEASAGLIQQIGVPAIFAHANRYLDELEAGLVARGFTSLRSPDPARRSCILGVLPPEGESVVELQRALGARKIACSMPDGVLRFAPHWPNNPAEIPIVLEALDEARAELRGL
jgi:cysteine desulfurase/selenocysteine lyase